MPPRARTAGTPAAASRSTGVFARLKAEAGKGQPPVVPYVIDDVEPAIVIQAPTDTETQIGLAEVFDANGDFNIRDARRILELICGDSFPAVWELFRKEHISVMVQLIIDMSAHFGPTLTGDVPETANATPA